MLSIKDAKVALSELGFTEEELNKYEQYAIPHIEFHKYLMEKKDISSEEVEKMTQDFSKNYILKHSKDVNDNISNNIKLAGEAIKILALDNKYDLNKADELKQSLINLSKLMEKTVKKLQSKK